MIAPSSIHIRRGARWDWFGTKDIWQYRGLLLTLGGRDVRLRYKQTLLGVFWVVAQPLLSAGLLTAVFGLIAGMPSPEGVPYFVLAYTGQMGWSLFSLTVARTSNALLGSMVMVIKIYFPRPILPLATIVAVLLDFAISFAIAVPLVVIYGSGSVNLPVLLTSGVAMVMFATGIGFGLSALSVRYRDALYILPLLVQLGLYASPVAYGLDVASRNLTAYSPTYFALYMLNPLASLVEAFRWALIGHGLFLPGYFAYGVGMSVLVFAAGFVVFRLSEGKFADVI